MVELLIRSVYSQLNIWDYCLHFNTSHIETHQLVDAVNSPVVLVTKSLHAFKAVETTTQKMYLILLEKNPQNFNLLF